jgi:hypothetical protein
VCHVGGVSCGVWRVACGVFCSGIKMCGKVSLLLMAHLFFLGGGGSEVENHLSVIRFPKFVFLWGGGRVHMTVCSVIQGVTV